MYASDRKRSGLMSTTDNGRQNSCRIFSMSNDSLYLDINHDPDLSYMFDVEGSISVPALQASSDSTNRFDEKYNAPPSHCGSKSRSTLTRISDASPSSKTNSATDRKFAGLFGARWSDDCPERHGIDDSSVQTSPELVSTPSSSSQRRDAEFHQSKSVAARSVVPFSRQSSIRKSRAPREGRYKLVNGGLVAADKFCRQNSSSSVVSSLTMDTDDESTVFTGCSYNSSSQQKTQRARPHFNQWWRLGSSERDLSGRHKPPKKSRDNVREGRFRMKNGQFVPVGDSNSSNDHSIDVIAEAVRKAAEKSQRSLAV